MQLAGFAEVLGAGAERLLIGASVYREPVERNALLFQIGQRDWTATSGPGRPDQEPHDQEPHDQEPHDQEPHDQEPHDHKPADHEPADLGSILAACEAAGVLTVAAPCGPPDRQDAARPGAFTADLPTVFVERGTASELHRLLEAADRGCDLAAAHRCAAEYWQWRAAAWPQGPRADLHDLLEARHHLLTVGETEQACELTEVVCSQLHAWCDLGREAELISDTLSWLPAHSANRAALLQELGKIAQVRSDYAEAECCYQQALDIFAAVGDRTGVARSHHCLGVLAQAQGEYARAELRYQQSIDAAGDPATAPPAPAPPTAAPPAPPTAAPPAPPIAAPPALPPATPAQPQAATPPVQRSVICPEPAGAMAAAPGPVAASPQAGSAGRWRLPALAAAAAVVLLALSAADTSGAFTPAGQASLPASGAADAAAVREQAAAWVAGQVSGGAIVGCDPAMCADLQARGVAEGDLLVLGPAAPDPLGSDVVVATSAVRSDFGSRLAGVYAPVVLASFGSGGARIEIRVVAPDGAAAYREALAADLAARRQAGAQLLRNPRISVPAAARRQLSDGSVDARVLITIATLAGMGQLHIISFGAPAAGASAGVPLRSVEIAGPAALSVPAGIDSEVASHGTGRMSSAASLSPVVAFLRAQRAPYLAAVIRVIQLPAGQTAVRIGFASPSPLGLLGLLAASSPAAGQSPS